MSNKRGHPSPLRSLVLLDERHALRAGERLPLEQGVGEAGVGGLVVLDEGSDARVGGV